MNYSADRPFSMHVFPESLRLRMFLVLVMTIGGLWLASARGEPASLFFEDAADGLGTRGAQALPNDFPSARRFRPVALSPRVADPDALTLNDNLILNLFDDVSYTAAIDRVSVNVNGTVTIRGRIEGHPYGTVLISTTGSRSLGSVLIPEQGRHFLIQSGPGDEPHYLLDLDEGLLDKAVCGGVLTPPPPEPVEDGAAEAKEAVQGAGPSDPATIDVMIVYTPAARNWANTSGGGIANVIAQAMERLQLTADNSATYADFELVHSAEVSYVESGNSSTDLSRLRLVSDGHMDEVHAWRNEFGADLVALFARVDDVGGIAYLLNTTAGQPTLGFSLTRVQQAGWTFTHAHELGHNMGCHHHKQQNTQPGPGLFSYSAGWRWISTGGGRFCSIMTYSSGSYFPDGQTHTRVAHFSNPDILHQGAPSGHAADGDNARTIRETKHVVANYRQRPNHPPNTPTLISPANGATGISLTPTLQASSFSDPDGDGHANSHWQISHNSGFTNLAWDTGTGYQAGTQVTVSSGILEYSTTYHWRVRYKDSRDAWSDWSSSRWFSTASTGACCHADESCNVLTATQCTSAGGTYQGDGTGCSPNPCSLPTGACCLPDGSCLEVTQAECMTAASTYQGDGSTCGTVDCPQPFLSRDLDGDGDVDMSDFGVIQACLGGLGVPTAPGCEMVDFGQDGYIGSGDIDLFLQCLSGANVPADPECVTVTVNCAPVITAGPTDQKVRPGDPATFSVTATGASLSHQWQLDEGDGFANLPGETNSTLTIAEASEIPNGWEPEFQRYRVIVSNICGSVTSGEATLIVTRACCVGGDCSDFTLEACNGADGDFRGPGTRCDDDPDPCFIIP